MMQDNGKVKIRVKRRQHALRLLYPYRLVKDDLITVGPDERQAIERIFSILREGAGRDDALAIARTCLPLDGGSRWTRERLNAYCADPLHAGYCIRRDGEKYVMTRLNFPDPPVSLEIWLECNPLVRKRAIRLE
jgi:hypothetical protein